MHVCMHIAVYMQTRACVYVHAHLCMHMHMHGLNNQPTQSFK